MKNYNAKDEMFVKVIADSVTEYGQRIVTFHARYPRIIHGEVMTHRVFSRNARSSRAVPVKTILQEIIDKPFIPWHWGKNQKGMQATEECNEFVKISLPFMHDNYDYSELVYNDINHTRESAWLWARDQAVTAAKGFMDAGYHKQVINRLLEPYSWIDTLITTTDLANFYHLRDHGDAEPHFHDLAKLVRQAVAASVPVKILEGQWHIPFISPDEINLDIEIKLKLSVARCARISYKPFDGDGSHERELERYDLLVGSEPLHASPAEHQAMADYIDEWGRFENCDKAGNLGRGFMQYRKTLKNECVYGEW